jgi:hypothetical protein
LTSVEGIGIAGIVKRAADETTGGAGSVDADLLGPTGIKARAAVLVIGQQVDFAAVTPDPVAVAPPRVTNGFTRALDALSGRIRSGRAADANSRSGPQQR